MLADAPIETIRITKRSPDRIPLSIALSCNNRIGIFTAGGLWLRADFTGAMGLRPAYGEGKPELTTAPWSPDHGDGNSGRLPLQTAVDGESREVREEEPHAAVLRSER